jgi:hypothetical protein
MKPDKRGLITKRVGSPQVFAIEFELDPNQTGPIDGWWGRLWLWVDSRCIGNNEVKEMVSIGLGSLTNGARYTGSRGSHLLSSMLPNQALDAVMWAVYGDNDPQFERLVDKRTTLQHFEILPLTDPFFDHWEAILVEEGDTERFIYRQEGHEAYEAKWRLGTFKDVVLSAQAEFSKISHC